jgi:hypothetical protein
VNNNLKSTEVGGNFYNYNGSTSYTGLGSGVGGSRLTFTCRNNGGVSQLFRNDGTALTLNNVTINQVVVSSVRLNAGAFSDMIIGTAGILTLTNGRIITTAAPAREVSVLNNTSIACSPGNSNSYVEGNLRRAIGATASSYDFPVGDGTSALAPGIVGYERANITFTTAPSSAFNLLATFYRWTLGGVAFPGNGPAASECVTATYNALPYFNHGYWRLDAGGTASGIYRIILYNSLMSNNSGLGWTVVKAPSGTGTFALSGNCFIGSTAAQTRRDNLSGFSDFATVQSQNPLPIELLYFDADAKGESVACTWATASEINNDRFELERSYDHENFELITKVKGYGAGVSSQTLYYMYTDEGICKGTLYYRLKQVDIDGASTYSNTVAVNCGGEKTIFTLFPNPVTEKLIVSKSHQLNFETEVMFSIYNIFGEKVNDGHLYFSDSRHTPAEIDVQSLPPGLYLFEAETIDGIFRSKFVKR